MANKINYRIKPTQPQLKFQRMQAPAEVLANQERESAERQVREARELIEESDAIRRCVYHEGGAAFYRWFESPMIEALPRGMRIEFIERRIAKHERSVANEGADGEKSKQEAEGQP